MRYIGAFFRWLLSLKMFFLIMIVSTLVFFAMLFPFSDLSNLATTVISQASGNQVFMQFGTFDVSLFPSPGVSGTDVTIDTPAFSGLEAGWIKVGPTWPNLIRNAFLLKKAASGDPEAVQKVPSRIALNLSGEKIMDGKIDFQLRPGHATDQGERSHITLSVENINLNKLQKATSLPL
jgi:hypothetical protein